MHGGSTARSLQISSFDEIVDVPAERVIFTFPGVEQYQNDDQNNQNDQNDRNYQNDQNDPNDPNDIMPMRAISSRPPCPHR